MILPLDGRKTHLPRRLVLTMLVAMTMAMTVAAIATMSLTKDGRTLIARGRHRLTEQAKDEHTERVCMATTTKGLIQMNSFMKQDKWARLGQMAFTRQTTG